jgi:hypothetical protein
MGALAPCTWQHTESRFSLLSMHEILARMMRRRHTRTLTSLQCGTTSRRRNVGSGGMRSNAALRRADVTSGVEACADPFWQPAFAVLTPFIKMSYRPHCHSLVIHHGNGLEIRNSPDVRSEMILYSYCAISGSFSSLKRCRQASKS